MTPVVSATLRSELEHHTSVFVENEAKHTFGDKYQEAAELVAVVLLLSKFSILPDKQWQWLLPPKTSTGS